MPHPFSVPQALRAPGTLDGPADQDEREARITDRVQSPGLACSENGGMAVKYDRIGDTYDFTRRPDPRIADRLNSLLGASAGAPVLDVACGTGNYT